LTSGICTDWRVARLVASGAASIYTALAASREMLPERRVLALTPDSGERYLSSDLFG
jgi:cysteine synthase